MRARDQIRLSADGMNPPIKAIFRSFVRSIGGVLSTEKRSSFRSTPSCLVLPCLKDGPYDASHVVSGGHDEGCGCKEEGKWSSRATNEWGDA